jgi:RNA 2',3'-cyclic 3'-phosphodiesterase
MRFFYHARSFAIPFFLETRERILTTIQPVRCFVALDLPRPVRNHLLKVTGPLRDRYDIRWVTGDQIRMTLMFGGELPDQNADQITQLLENIDLPPLSICLDSFGAFPPRGMPRVIWAGIGGDVDSISRLQAELAEQAEPLGFEREKRGFTPHVTLGRVQGQFGLLALIDQMKELGKELNTKPFKPESLTLYRSTLTPSGPVYDTMLRRMIE